MTVNAMVKVRVEGWIKVSGLPGTSPSTVLRALREADFDDIIDEDLSDYVDVIEVDAFSVEDDDDYDDSDDFASDLDVS